MSWDAYRNAVVRMSIAGVDVIVGPRDVVGQESVAWPDTQGRTVHIITAENPNGVFQSSEANSSATRALNSALAQLPVTHWPAVGGHIDGTHSEASFAIVGMSDESALQLGREFGQQAIFAWRPDSWDLIDCADGTVDRQIWGARTLR